MQKKPIPPLSAEAISLLPTTGESFRCSVFTSTLGVNPAGSAISAEIVVLVDTPLPWPKPVFDHPHLKGVSGKITTPQGQSIRVLAAVPEDGRPLGLTVFFKSIGDTVTTRIPFRSQSPGEIVASLMHTSPDLLPNSESGPKSAVLVCTQGTHDVCCGTDGSALVAELSADQRFDDVEIFRVSHTGGHRFAPTAMTFPDGRMWAFVGPDQLAGALFKTGAPSQLAPWCRGVWSAPSPRTQAAECALFARSGWGDVGGVMSFVDDPNTDIVEVSIGSIKHRVRVTTAREIPIIRCRADGGLPAKPSLEYRAEVL